MKKTKRLLSILLAIAMLFTLAVPLGAVAAETPGVTIDNINPVVGDVLTATITPEDEGALYHWYRYNTVDSTVSPIPGAIGKSYTVIPEDAGYALLVGATLSDKSKIELDEYTDRVTVRCNYGDQSVYKPADPNKKPIVLGFDGSMERFNGSVGMELVGSTEITLGKKDYTVQKHEGGIRLELSTDLLDRVMAGKYYLHAYFKGGVRGEANFSIVAKNPVGDVGLDQTLLDVGDTVTALPDSQDVTADYAWCATDEKNRETIIPGATSKSYTIAPEYVGYTISVKVTGNGEYEGTTQSEATLPINAECIEPPGEYNQLDPNRKDLRFVFSGDYRRLEPQGTLSCTAPGGVDTALPQEAYGFAEGTATALVYKAYLDTLEPGIYAITAHYLGGGKAKTLVVVESAAVLESVSINNPRPSVGDVLQATVKPENTPATFTWWRTADGRTLEEIGKNSPNYSVREEDVGYRIMVMARVKDVDIGTVKSGFTEPVWAVCSEGEGSSYNPGQDLIFKFNGALSMLISETPITVASVAGQAVSIRPEDYVLTAGSTVVTLKNAFLATLAPGNYILAAHYPNQVKAEAQFLVPKVKPDPTVKPTPTVKPAPTPKPEDAPKTGDNSNNWLWSLLGLCAVCGLGTLVILGKKQTR